MHFIPAPAGTRGLFGRVDGYTIHPVAFICVEECTEDDLAMSLECIVHHYAINGERACALLMDNDIVLHGSDWFELNDWLTLMDGELAEQVLSQV